MTDKTIDVIAKAILVVAGLVATPFVITLIILCWEAIVILTIGILIVSSVFWAICRVFGDDGPPKSSGSIRQA